MPTDEPAEHSQSAPRSLIRRVAIFAAAGVAVIVAFAIAYYAGAFAAR
jgi:hypothetical protein